MLNIFLRKLLEAKLLRPVRRWLTGGEETEPGKEVSCGDGCYDLSDGTLVPLGDLGVGPEAYNLKK